MIVAASDWAEVVVAIAIVAMIAFLGSGVVWQTLAARRGAPSPRDEKAYRELAEQSAESQRKTAVALEKTVAELSELKRRVGEVERLLKEVG